jgi:hypothetical protein
MQPCDLRPLSVTCKSIRASPSPPSTARARFPSRSLRLDAIMRTQAANLQRNDDFPSSAQGRVFPRTDPAFEPSPHRHRPPQSGNTILRSRDKGAETPPVIQSTIRRDKIRAPIPAGSGHFVMNKEISVCAGMRGGPGRTRTSNQAVMSR